MAESLQFEDLQKNINRLISDERSFSVIGLSGNKMTQAIEIIEGAIEGKGLSCRIYTSGRIAAVGGSFFGGVTGIAGVVSGIAIAAHNLATYNPDYEIAKDIVNNKLAVEFKIKI